MALRNFNSLSGNLHGFVRGVAAVALFAAPVAGCAEEITANVTHTIEWQQEPNTEIQKCHYFKLTNPDPVEIKRLSIKFPPGSHHVHLYRSDTPEPEHVEDCWTAIDWDRWHLVLGAQTQEIDWQLPEDLTVPFEANQQLLAQVHWLNTEEATINNKIDISFEKAEYSRDHVGVVFGVNKQVAMQPHERKVISTWCPMPEGAKLVALMGHYHGLGEHYNVWSRLEDEARSEPGKIYNALDEQTFQFKFFDPMYEVPENYGFEYECAFNNYRDVPINWSADTKTGEHCNMVAYYQPARELSQFCMVDYTEVTSITPSATAVKPGEKVTYTVALSEATRNALQVRVEVSDRTVLDAPRVIQVPPGATSLTIEARALRPARATVTARLGSTSKVVATTVSGLVLSEVFVGPDRKQWVEIANLSDLPIDLSGYSLGAGKDDYTRTRVQLNAAVQPRGCIVVGGPELTHTGQPAYDQSIDFAPTLGLGGSTASGIGLFDMPADRITAQTLPYDALVYGEDNNVLRGPAGDVLPVIALPPLNGTFFRMDGERWATQPGATPRICEVH